MEVLRRHRHDTVAVALDVEPEAVGSSFDTMRRTGKAVRRSVTAPRAAIDRGCRIRYGADTTKAQRLIVGPRRGLDVPSIDRDAE